MDRWNQLATRIKRGQSFSGYERNRCFLNTREGRFADVSAITGLDLMDDGRAIAATDWDRDGDVDFWVANRTAPRIRFLQNDLNPRGSQSRGISLGLVGVQCNRDAIGARVEIIVDPQQPRLTQTLTAGDGFASQSSKWLHFGVGKCETVDQVRIHWPGATGEQVFEKVASGARYLARQGSQSLQSVLAFSRAPHGAKSAIAQNGDGDSLAKSTTDAGTPSVGAHIILAQRRQLDSVTYEPLTGGQTERWDSSTSPTLVVFWASWCHPCLTELEELSQGAKTLQDAGLRVVALSIDGLPQSELAADNPSQTSGRDAARQLAGKLRLPYLSGFATTSLMQTVTDVERNAFYRERPFTLPYAVLLDESNRAAVIYRGALPINKLTDDLKRLRQAESTPLTAARPFGGRQIAHWFAPTALNVAKAYFESGALDQSENAIKRALQSDDLGREQTLEAWQLATQIAASQQNTEQEINALKHWLKLQPGRTDLRIRLAVIQWTSGRDHERKSALTTIEGLVNQAINSTDVLLRIAAKLIEAGDVKLSMRLLDRAGQNPTKISRRQMHDRLMLTAGVKRLQGDVPGAIELYERILEQAPDRIDVANNLAWVLATHPDDRLRNAQRAVLLSRRAVQRTGPSIVELMDTHAAALAASGQFAEAEKWARRATQQARATERHKLAAKIQQRFNGYRAGKAFTDGALQPSNTKSNPRQPSAK